MKNLDFMVRLSNHVEQMGLYAPIEISMLGPKDSIAVLALPGGAEVEYMDGSKDKDYNVQFNAKSKEQLVCMNALNAIGHELQSLTALPSTNGSYEFDKILVPNLPSFVGQDEQGYSIWQLTVTAKIFIEKGVV